MPFTERLVLTLRLNIRRFICVVSAGPIARHRILFTQNANEQPRFVCNDVPKCFVRLSHYILCKTFECCPANIFANSLMFALWVWFNYQNITLQFQVLKLCFAIMTKLFTTKIKNKSINAIT